VRADAEGLTAQRVKIVGQLTSEMSFGVRSYLISTANEDLPHARGGKPYKDDQTRFGLSFAEDQFPNLGDLHEKRVIATGSIYFFPGDEAVGADTIFMLESIQEYEDAETPDQPREWHRARNSRPTD
jgi:hypothetical protein